VHITKKVIDKAEKPEIKRVEKRVEKAAPDQDEAVAN
jgi:hypothetical protein